jgi:hypothetical protein
LLVVKKPEVKDEVKDDFLDDIIKGIESLGREKATPLTPTWSPTTIRNTPRILVCAPSNAAVDEILGRVISEEFFDNSDKKYRPHILRVGHSTK